MSDFSDNTCGIIVGQVTETRGNALLGAHGALRRQAKKLGVVVGFKVQRLDALEVLQNGGGDATRVRDIAERGVARFNTEADRISGIVRDGEGGNGEIAQGEGLLFFKANVRDVRGLITEFLAGVRGTHDRNFMFLGKLSESRAMIVVIVRNKNGIEMVRMNADLHHALFEAQGAETRINKDCSCVSFDN